MAIQNGTLIKLYNGANAIALLTSSDMSLEREMLDATNKDSSGWREVQAGLRQFSFSAELFSDPANTDETTLYTAWEAGTVLTMKLSSEIAGQKKYTGSVLINSISKSAPMEQLSTLSVEFTGTGALVEATI
jgi:predicted secreted protein